MQQLVDEIKQITEKSLQEVDHLGNQVQGEEKKITGQVSLAQAKALVAAQLALAEAEKVLDLIEKSPECIDGD